MGCAGRERRECDHSFLAAVADPAPFDCLKPMPGAWLERGFDFGAPAAVGDDEEAEAETASGDVDSDAAKELLVPFGEVGDALVGEDGPRRRPVALGARRTTAPGDGLASKRLRGAEVALSGDRRCCCSCGERRDPLCARSGCGVKCDRWSSMDPPAPDRSLETLLRPRAWTGEAWLWLRPLALEADRLLIDCSACAAALVILRVCGYDGEADAADDGAAAAAEAPCPFAA